jgi:hypothetical protein
VITKPRQHEKEETGGQNNYGVWDSVAKRIHMYSSSFCTSWTISCRVVGLGFVTILKTQLISLDYLYFEPQLKINHRWNYSVAFWCHRQGTDFLLMSEKR